MVSTTTKYSRARIALHMTDEDVVHRAADIIGPAVQRVTEHPPQKEHHKVSYKIIVDRADAVLLLCERLRPFMGERRSAQIDGCIEAARAAISRRVQAQHGTPFMYNQGCRCAPCKLAKSRKNARRVRN